MKKVSYSQNLAKLIELIDQAGKKLREENANTASLREIQYFLKNTNYQSSMSNDEYLYCYG